MQKGMLRQHDTGSIYKKIWKILLSDTQFCKQSDINLHLVWCTFTYKLHYTERM